MLFHGKNLTASADNLEWNGQKWSIVNHFIPFTETEVHAPDRFESDFMVQYLADKILSTEATAVLDAGRTLWQAFFTHTDVRTVRDEFKLNRADVGWYQIRNALRARNISGDTIPIDFRPFERAYKTLGDKLHPMVFELGFLRWFLCTVRLDWTLLTWFSARYSTQLSFFMAVVTLEYCSMG